MLTNDITQLGYFAKQIKVLNYPTFNPDENGVVDFNVEDAPYGGYYIKSIIDFDLDHRYPNDDGCIDLLGEVPQDDKKMYLKGLKFEDEEYDPDENGLLTFPEKALKKMKERSMANGKYRSASDNKAARRDDIKTAKT
jgi:hypothetical protein